MRCRICKKQHATSLPVNRLLLCALSGCHIGIRTNVMNEADFFWLLRTRWKKKAKKKYIARVRSEEVNWDTSKPPPPPESHREADNGPGLRDCRGGSTAEPWVWRGQTQTDGHFHVRGRDLGSQHLPSPMSPASAKKSRFPHS